MALEHRELGSHHGRACLCVATRGAEAVSGGADHSLFVWDLERAAARRELFRQNGHSEWVTCCAYLSDGRVISGGMDSNVVIWDGVRGSKLEVHSASVSCLATDEHNTAITASYDGTMVVWSASARRAVATLAPPAKKHALTALWWQNSLVVSGDRDGGVAVWNINTPDLLHAKPVHKGETMKVAVHEPFLLSAGQDGTLAAADLRANYKRSVLACHAGASLNDFALCGPYAITAGADHKLCVFDVRVNMSLVHTLEGHRDAVFNVRAYDGIALSGSGCGDVLAHDVATGRCHFGFGACAQAVRCLEVNDSHEYVVVGGDDGSVVVLNTRSFNLA